MNPATETTEAPAFPPVLLERIGFLIAMTKGGAHDIVARSLEPLGLHPKEQGLLSVLVTEGPRSQQDLSAWTRFDRTTMVGLVDSLEAKGLVRRERNPADRRAYLLQVTPEGKKTQRRAQAVMEKAEGRLLASLTEDERDTLRELLAKVATDVGRPPPS